MGAGGGAHIPRAGGWLRTLPACGAARPAVSHASAWRPQQRLSCRGQSAQRAVRWIKDRQTSTHNECCLLPARTPRKQATLGLLQAVITCRSAGTRLQQATDHPVVQVAAAVLRVFPPRGELRLLPPSEADPSSMDRIIIQEYVIDTLLYFDADHAEMSRRLMTGGSMSLAA